jgi:hypothetical protein
MSLCKQVKVTARAINNYQLILVIISLSLFTVGCEEKKSVQCEQIFRVVKDVKQNNQNASDANQQSDEIKSWLQAANRFDRAADRLAILKIDRSELITYQNQLVTIYRIYSQATYDAVSAKENLNLPALKSARQDAVKAGIIQHKLIRQINNYCLKNR